MMYLVCIYQIAISAAEERPVLENRIRDADIEDSVLSKL